MEFYNKYNPDPNEQENQSKEEINNGINYDGNSDSNETDEEMFLFRKTIKK